MFIKHVLRSIKDSIGRSFIIIVSILISAMVIFLNFVTNNDIVAQYEEAQKGIYHDYDVLVTSDELFFKFIDLDYEKDKVEDTIELSYYVIEDKDKESTFYKLLGTDVDKLVEGGLITCPATLEKNPVLISKSTADNNKLKVNDKISFSMLEKKKKISVTNLCEDRGLFQAESTFPLIIMDKDMLIKKTGINNNEVSALLINLKDDVDITEFVRSIKDDNKDFSAVDLKNSAEAESNFSTIRMILMIVLLIVILLNVYIIISNSKVILSNRLFTMGTFRSVGATQSRVAMILILENVIYGIIGGALGVLSALLIRKPVITALVGTAPEKLEYNATTIIYIVATIVFSILLQIICTLSQIVKQSKKSIRSILFEKENSAMQLEISKTGIGIVLGILSFVFHYINNDYNILYASLSLICAIFCVIMILPLVLKAASKLLSACVGKIFGYPVELGARNLGYSKSTCSNVILITVALTIILSIYMLSNSLVDLLKGATSIFDCDVRITQLTEPADEYDFIKDDVKEVTRIVPGYYFADSMEYNNGWTFFTVIGLDREYQGVNEESGKHISELGENEALIDSYYASRLGISVGDTLTLSNDEFRKKKIEVKVVGFVESSLFSVSRNALVISEKEYIEKVSDIPSVLNISIKGINPDEAKNKLRRTLAQYDVVIQTVNENIDYQLQTTSTIVDLVWLILILSILLALVGVINNTIFGFMQRKREYAVLNSVAMAKVQIVFIMFAELVFSVLCGCICAVVTSLWLNNVLTDLLYSIGLCFKVNIDIKNTLFISGMTFVCLLFTVIVPITSMKKMVIVNEIKLD